jgi:hypothetical protein
MRSAVAPTQHAEIQRLINRGVESCREGRWREGLELLGGIAGKDRQGAELSGLYYSYLGYGIARYERRVKEGLSLCEHSIKIQFYEPENYVNLARVWMLKRNRRHAAEALQQAININAYHPAVRKLVREMGVRSKPVIPFLSRDNPLNYFLGRLRHQRRKEV